MPYERALQPKLKELILPEVGKPWGNLRRFDLFSRYAIDDTDFDKLDNFISQGAQLRQTPGASAPFATLPGGAVVWMSAQVLNLGLYIFVLSTNGKLYQISPGGAIINCNPTTPASLSANTDLTNWQGTVIILTDPNSSTIYSWNGTTMTTVFSSQPATRLAVFGGRLWGANNSTIWYTAGGTYSSLAGDAGSLIITEADCTSPISVLYPFGGMLYIFGPNWIQVLGNLAVSGAPAVLQFTKYTLENQVGTTYRWSICAYGSMFYFANTYGVFVVQGTFPIKISDPIDGYYAALLAGTNFSAGFSTIYNQPLIFFQAICGDNANAVFGVNAQGGWFRGVFPTLTFVTSFFLSSGAPVLYGTDGTNLFSLFTSLTSPVTSVASFKFWNFGTAIGYQYVQKGAFAMATTGTVAMSVQLSNEGSQVGAPIPFSFATGFVWLDATNTPYIWKGQDTNTYTWLQLSVEFNMVQFNCPFTSRIFSIDLTLTGAGTVVFSLSFEVMLSQAGWGS